MPIAEVSSATHLSTARVRWNNFLSTINQTIKQSVQTAEFRNFSE